MMTTKSRFKNVGTQLTHATVLDGVFDPVDPHILYTVVSGPPAHFVCINWKTGEQLKNIPMPGVVGAWALAISTTGKVYLGTNMDGHLYEYCPNTEILRDLGQPVPNQSHIWDLCPGPEGKIYGGTYDQCALFVYDPEQDRCEIVKSNVVESEHYIRSLVYDFKRDHLYLGIGSHAHLIQYDCATGQTTECLPPHYTKKQFAYYMDIQGDHLFVKMDTGNEVAIIDLTSSKMVYELLNVNSRSISPMDPKTKKIYYTSRGFLHYYDLHDNIHQSLDIKLPASWIETTFIDDYLVGFLGNGSVFEYHLLTKELQLYHPTLPKQNCPIQSILKGPDGNIYSGGYLVGGVAKYNPKTQTSEEYHDIHQTEGMATLGSCIYFGVYRNAILYEYNTQLPWDASKGNPKRVFDLMEYKQDRPFAMIGLEDKNLLAMGTFPDYGTLGGALTLYNPVSGAWDVYPNIIPNHSIASLTYKDGLLIGGTSIWGGIGAIPIETEARLFIFDVEKRQVVFDFVPVQNKKAITALQIAPDGTIWGLAEGNLFIFNLESRQILYSKNLFPVDYKDRSFVFRDAFFTFTHNGLIYGTIGGQFFQLDPETKETRILKEENAILLTVDDEGQIYFGSNHELWCYTPPRRI